MNMKMYFDTADYFRPSVLEELRQRIAAYHGQEVFVGGLVDEDGKVYEAEVLSRGNENATPVVYRQAEKYDVVVHNHPTGVIRPSEADLEVASVLGDYGLGFYIVDNAYTQVNVVIPRAEKEERKKISRKRSAGLFFQFSKNICCGLLLSDLPGPRDLRNLRRKTFAKKNGWGDSEGPKPR